MWPKWENQIVTKVKKKNIRNMAKLKTEIVRNIRNSNCDKTCTLELWQNLKTQIAKQLKDSNSDKFLKHINVTKLK